MSHRVFIGMAGEASSAACLLNLYLLRELRGPPSERTLGLTLPVK